MNKYDLMVYLTEEAKTELGKDEAYEKAIEKAKEIAKKNGNERNYWMYVPRNTTRTSKAKIKDNMKMVRRIALEISKEMHF
jgi:hypothetical protein